eukprot:727785-Prorocentrum_minimum.AAC.2
MPSSPLRLALTPSEAQAQSTAKKARSQASVSLLTTPCHLLTPSDRPLMCSYRHPLIQEAERVREVEDRSYFQLTEALEDADRRLRMELERAAAGYQVPNPYKAP